MAPRSRLAGAGSKTPQAAVVKSHGGERWGKGPARQDQLWIRETSTSEPLMRCRKLRARSKLVAISTPG
ncbi:MAG: hypothetical protein ACR2PH_12945 [Desulfobulbia bacterium]